MVRGKRSTIVPVQEGPEMLTISFSRAKIHECGRTDQTSGWASFHCPLIQKDLLSVFGRMKWGAPAETTSKQELDGKLESGNFILTAKGDTTLQVKSKDGSVDTGVEVDIEFSSITKFACHRLESEGHKNKGFRRELRFVATFKCKDGCANLENYMVRSNNAEGALKIAYLKEPVQSTIETDDQKQTSLIPDDVQANDEQRSGAMEIQ